MLKSRVLLLAEAYHFLAHWKEIVCMSSVLCVSSIDGMHTFPVWMQIHFHLFLGIVIIPHHTYSSTYTRTRPLARVVWNPFRIAGVALWILSGCSQNDIPQGVQRGLLRFASARTTLCQMRKGRRNAQFQDFSACPWKGIISPKNFDDDPLFIRQNGHGHVELQGRTQRKKTSCLHHLVGSMGMSRSQGLPVSPNPPVFSDVFRMGNFLGVPHFWRKPFFSGFGVSRTKLTRVWVWCDWIYCNRKDSHRLILSTLDALLLNPARPERSWFWMCHPSISWFEAANLRLISFHSQRCSVEDNGSYICSYSESLTYQPYGTFLSPSASMEAQSKLVSGDIKILKLLGELAGCFTGIIRRFYHCEWLCTVVFCFFFWVVCRFFRKLLVGKPNSSRVWNLKFWVKQKWVVWKIIVRKWPCEAVHFQTNPIVLFQGEPINYDCYLPLFTQSTTPHTLRIRVLPRALRDNLLEEVGALVEVIWFVWLGDQHLRCDTWIIMKHLPAIWRWTKLRILFPVRILFWPRTTSNGFEPVWDGLWSSLWNRMIVFGEVRAKKPLPRIVFF